MNPSFGKPKGHLGGSYDWWWNTFGLPANLPYKPPSAWQERAREMLARMESLIAQGHGDTIVHGGGCTDPGGGIAPTTRTVREMADVIRAQIDLVRRVNPAPCPPRVGVVQISPPTTGKWPFVGFPRLVDILGGSFRLSEWKWPKQGVAAQYRESVPTNSRHLYVLRNGYFVVSHRDEVNPDMGSPAQHFIRDVMKRPARIDPLEAELRRKATPL